MSTKARKRVNKACRQGTTRLQQSSGIQRSPFAGSVILNLLGMAKPKPRPKDLSIEELDKMFDQK